MPYKKNDEWIATYNPEPPKNKNKTDLQLLLWQTSFIYSLHIPSLLVVDIAKSSIRLWPYITWNHYQNDPEPDNNNIKLFKKSTKSVFKNKKQKTKKYKTINQMPSTDTVILFTPSLLECHKLLYREETK